VGIALSLVAGLAAAAVALAWPPSSPRTSSLASLAPTGPIE
jgi:hypothetical protein